MDEFKNLENESLEPQATAPEAPVEAAVISAPEIPAAEEEAAEIAAPEAPAAEDEATEIAAPEAPAAEEEAAEIAAPEAPAAEDKAAEIAAPEAPAAEDEATEIAAPEPETQEAAPETMEDALVQELEGIRDLLQQELDNAGNEPLIQELDEIEQEPAEPEEIPEAERCVCCGERRRDLLRGEDYPYCEECRAVMKAAPLRLPAVLMTIFTFVLAAASLYFCALYLMDCSTLLEAETCYEANELSDAAALYASYMSEKQGAELAGPTDFQDAYSITAVKHLADTFTRMGYLGDANELLTTYLGEDALKRPWNKKYLAMTEDYNDLKATSTAINEIMQDVLYYGVTDIDYKERDEQLQALLLEQNEDGAPKYDAAFVEFYRYVLLDLQDSKPQAMLEQLQRVQQLDENRHPWMYLSTMANLASKIGDEALTMEYADACLAINTQEAAAYQAKANLYRFQSEPDADKILAIAEEEQAHLSTTGRAVPTYQELFAIGYLLKGDYEKAMQAMEAYMGFTTSSGTPGYSVTSCNLYALCSVLCGNQEGYDEMAQIFATAGLEPSKLIKQYQKGKITLVELLQDNGGEF